MRFPKTVRGGWRLCFCGRLWWHLLTRQSLSFRFPFMLVKHQLWHLCLFPWALCWPHWSRCLSSAKNLLSWSLPYRMSWNWVERSLPNLFLFLQMVLIIPVPLHFHVNSGISLSAFGHPVSSVTFFCTFQNPSRRRPAAHKSCTQFVSYTNFVFFRLVRTPFKYIFQDSIVHCYYIGLFLESHNHTELTRKIS